MKPTMALDQSQVLIYTVEIWQPHSPEPLTLEDGREIVDNMVELFTYLIELKQKHDQEEANV